MKKLPGRPRSRGIVRVVALALVLVFVALLLARQWPRVRPLLGRLDPAVVAAATAAVLAGIYATFRSWRAVLADLGFPLPHAPAMRVFFLGQLGKYLPGSVWPVVAQMELGRDYGVAERSAAASAAVAMLLSVATGLVVAVPTVPLLGRAAFGHAWWVLVALPLALMLLAPPVLNRLIGLALKLARRAPLPRLLSLGGVARSAGWAIVAWAAFGVQIWVLAARLGGGHGLVLLLGATGAFAVAWCAGFLLVAVPAGAGVREAGLIVLLGLAVSTASATVVAVVSRLLFVVGDLGWGAVALLATHRGQRHRADGATVAPGRPLRVCLFGTYDPVAHPRIAILRTALEAAGAEVAEAHVPGWKGGTREKLAAAQRPLAPGRLLRLAGNWISLARRYHTASPHDVVLVGYFGHLDVHLARWLTRRRPVVLDMMLSVYDTVVCDRGLVAPRSPLARLTCGIDRWAVRASDLALLDTPQQVEFCIRELGIPAAKLAAVPVGAEVDQFPPTPFPHGQTPGEPLRVLLYSSFIPLHGTLTVAAAIRLLTAEAKATAGGAARPIRFTIVGQGQDRPAFDQAIKAIKAIEAIGGGTNGETGTGAAAKPQVEVEVEVLDWVPYDQLGATVAAHHLVLGIFGQSDKAARVVPNKVYQAACAARAVVTADSPAMRDAFTDQEIVLVPPGDPGALASALRSLAADPERAARLGRRARERFEADYAPDAIGPRLLTLLERLQAARQAAPRRPGRPAVSSGGGGRAA